MNTMGAAQAEIWKKRVASLLMPVRHQMLLQPCRPHMPIRKQQSQIGVVLQLMLLNPASLGPADPAAAQVQAAPGSDPGSPHSSTSTSSLSSSSTSTSEEEELQPEPSEPPPFPPPAGPPPGPPATRRGTVRRDRGFLWGEHMITPVGPEDNPQHYQITCAFTAHNTGQKCTKIRSVKFGGKDVVLLCLKYWASLGAGCSTAEEHWKLWDAVVILTWKENRLPKMADLSSDSF